MKKVIVITGASSGIGKETARQLISEGHRVYPVARRIEQMQDLKAMGGFPMLMDITSDTDIQFVVDTVIKQEGKIDVLLNNAGYGIYGSVEHTSFEEVIDMYNVNLFGLAALTQKVVPYMREAGSGTIINTSSMGGKIYYALGAWYHSTKHALEGFSDCLRLELKPFNIKVVVVQPGLIATEFGDIILNDVAKIPKESPYIGMVNQFERGARKTIRKKGLSEPAVVSNAISKIVNSNHPKTRYRVGKHAKLLVWMRNYLGDRLFDKVISNVL